MDKPNFFKIGTIAFGIIIGIFAILVFSGRVPGLSSGGAEDVANKPPLDMWGVVDEKTFNDVMNEVSIQSQTQLSINYTQIDSDVLADRLAEAVAINNAPDLILAPAETLLSASSLLYPMSYQYMTELEYKDTFIDTTHQYALPFGALMYPVMADPMITFYNRNTLSQNGFTSPVKFWGELAKYEEVLTERGADGRPSKSAFAIGVFDNVRFAKDIFFAQLMQLGHIPVRASFFVDMNNQVVSNILTDVGMSSSGDDTVPNIVKLLRFQNAFSDPQKTTFTWSETGVNDFNAFVRESLPFYFARASEINKIREVNQSLDLGITYFPQFDNSKVSVTSGGVYGVSVVRTTEDPNYAVSLAIRISDNIFSSVISSVLGMSSARKDVLAGNDGSERAEVLSKSALIMKTFYDNNPERSTQLVSRLYSDILSGRKSIFEAASDFDRDWSKGYTR